jgi:hypothetical protein
MSDELFNEAALYPSNWDMETFKNLPSFNKRVQYAKERLGKLGQGSARIVFSIDDNTVIKIARNAKGLAQNEVEIDVGSKDWYPFVTKVTDFDSDNSFWLEAEKAKPIKKSEFKKITGYNFDSWSSVLFFKAKKHTNNVDYYILNEPLAKEIAESEFFNDILDMVVTFDMEPGDFRRINSWGVVNRSGTQQLVLLDLGLSNTVYKDFYYQGPRF